MDGKIVEMVTSFIFLEALIRRDGLCDKEIRRIIGMGKAAIGGLTTTGVNMEREWNQACHKSESGEGLGVPNSTVRGGDLDDEKSREEES